MQTIFALDVGRQAIATPRAACDAAVIADNRPPPGRRRLVKRAEHNSASVHGEHGSEQREAFRPACGPIVHGARLMVTRTKLSVLPRRKRSESIASTMHLFVGLTEMLVVSPV